MLDSVVQFLFLSSQFFSFIWLPLSAVMAFMVRWLEITATIWSMIWFLVLSLWWPSTVFVCESESALDVMKQRLVRVSDFSVTDNHLYFPSDSKQKCFASNVHLIANCNSSNVHLIANCNSSNVYLIANCGDELWINFACQTSEMLLASMRRSFILLSNAHIPRKKNENSTILSVLAWTDVYMFMEFTYYKVNYYK